MPSWCRNNKQHTSSSANTANIPGSSKWHVVENESVL